MNRRVLRFGAIMGAATVSMLAIAPVFAAAPVSQASSNALTLAIGGSPISSGTVKATNDGDDETKTGETNPVVGVLGNQNLLNIGVLAQEAQAKVADNGDGTSAACGGVAGEGAGFGANVGDSNCLTPGDPVGLNIANLDLTGTTVIDPTSAIGGLSALNGLLGDLLGPITSAISGALAPLGNTGLGGSLGAVYAHCTAAPGTAEGGANIVDSKLTLSVAGTDIDLVNLPANPPPNTHVLTDLDAVLNAVLDGVKVDLNETLDGLAAPLATVVDTVQTQLVNTLVAQVADALSPLEDNILDITLNKQTKTADTITVTALDLDLLPAAAQFTGSSLIAAQIGTVSCGPNGKKAATPSPTPTDDPTPDVPTVVDSGVSGQGNNTARDVLVATAALMMLAGTAGLIGYRRMLTK
ncbi:hypothetical protein ABIE44_002971 [Marmoricola sp. OAE513]|uniref:hypothetical protein n=1 Tax=Marmoricola sp. OAE513 TaxID=2817894 RepID=UPI001AE2A50E